MCYAPVRNISGRPGLARAAISPRVELEPRTYYITSQSPIPRATDGRLHSSEGIHSAVMVTAAPDRFDFPREEEKTLELWKRLDAFQTCLKQSKDRPRYTFYDGPPFATGLPHYGHILAGTIKVWSLKCLLYWGKPERARHIAVRRGLRPLCSNPSCSLLCTLNIVSSMLAVL